MNHHLRRDSKQFVEDNTKTFYSIEIISLEGFQQILIYLLSRIFHLRVTSQTKTMKDIINNVNDVLEVIYQKGPFKMKGKISD